MLSATFLGWQSWLLASESTRVLLDAVLVEEVGRGARGTRGRYPFWPPRRFEWDAFPAVDLVILTHEHDDHFSVPTLARIDRSIPVYLSALASTAAREILAEMGFTVRLIHAGETIRFRDLELSFFCGDHLKEQSTDEWSTLGILVSHLGGDGNFFTNVDVEVTPEMTEAVGRVSGPAHSQPPQTLSYEQMTLGLWGVPVGGGATFHGVPEGDGAPTFVMDHEALSTILAGERIRPVAGQTSVLEGGRLVAIEPRAPFLTWVPPPSDWDEKYAYGGRADEGPTPCCGVTDLREDEVADVEVALEQIAQHLHGGPLFRRLYSLSSRDLEGRKPTFVWCLFADADGGTYAYEYRPEQCNFVGVELEPDFKDHYIGVIMSWATDLLCIQRGELDPRSIARGYRSAWYPPCEDVAFFSQILWPFYHPLRHPAACLRQYRATLAEERDVPIWVHHGEMVPSEGG